MMSMYQPLSLMFHMWFWRRYQRVASITGLKYYPKKLTQRLLECNLVLMEHLSLGTHGPGGRLAYVL
jgi:hypothetical protein